VKSIDPFSSAYWEKAPATTKMDPPRVPLNTLKASSLTVNGASKPVKPFFTPCSDFTKSSDDQGDTITVMPAKEANAKPKKLVPAEDMPAFKAEVRGNNLSKIGLIEVLKKKFPGKSGAMIKNTLEIVAKRAGAKESDKRWVILGEDGA